MLLDQVSVHSHVYGVPFVWTFLVLMGRRERVMMRALARAGAFCRAGGPDFGTLISVFPFCVDASFWWGGKSVCDDEGPEQPRHVYLPRLATRLLSQEVTVLDTWT